MKEFIISLHKLLENLGNKPTIVENPERNTVTVISEDKEILNEVSIHAAEYGFQHKIDMVTGSLTISFSKDDSPITNLLELRDAIKALLLKYGFDNKFYIEQIIWCDDSKARFRYNIYDMKLDNKDVSSSILDEDDLYTHSGVLAAIEKKLQKVVNAQKELAHETH